MTERPPLLERLQQLAGRLAWLRFVFAALFVASLGYCAFILLVSNSRGQDIYFIPSLVLLIWSLLGFSSLLAFRHVPAQAQSSDTWRVRIASKLSRMAYFLLAILMGASGLALLVITWQLSSAWREMY
ncbi:MAG: hypothetical protein R3332_06975 [Pseudohongiellaceae bacterium]|nr:hypothetical protein [Pseudohongiellaceae bacterium]